MGAASDGLRLSSRCILRGAAGKCLYYFHLPGEASEPKAVTRSRFAEQGRAGPALEPRPSVSKICGMREWAMGHLVWSRGGTPERLLRWKGQWVGAPKGWVQAGACDSGGPGAPVQVLLEGSVLGSCNLCPPNDICRCV